LSVRMLLLGRGGPAFADVVTHTHPDLKERLTATGELDACAASAHVAACDILLQPYPDGISSRRTSVMAGLSLGRLARTTEGHLPDPLGRTSQAVEIAPADQLGATVVRLLADAARRAELARRAGELYQARFSLEHTIRLLREPIPS